MGSVPISTIDNVIIIVYLAVVMITSIAFTVYPVIDMARSRSFYEGILGLSPGYTFQDEWVEYNLGDSTFAITTTEMGHTPGAKGAVVAFEVADLDAFVNAMKAKLVTFVVDIFPTPVCRMAVIEDPDRNRIVIHKRH